MPYSLCQPLTGVDRVPLRGEALPNHVHCRMLHNEAGRLTLRIALKPTPARQRIRRVAGNPRDLQRFGVHPHVVAIDGGQHGRTVGNEGINHFLGRACGGKGFVDPSAPQDHPVIRMRFYVAFQ